MIFLQIIKINVRCSNIQENTSTCIIIIQCIPAVTIPELKMSNKSHTKLLLLGEGEMDYYYGKRFIAIENESAY